MSVLGRIFSARDKPGDVRRVQDVMGGSRFGFFFGGSSSGKAVNERSAMQMTAVYACVRVLSEAVAGLPLHVYRYKEDGSREKALKHPLYRLLHDEPNPEMSSFNFRETLMGHLLLYGNAYAQIIRNGRQNYRSKKSLGRIVKERILPVISVAAADIYNRFRRDFGVFLGFCLCRQI